jgi:hypothetical protein
MASYSKENAAILRHRNTQFQNELTRLKAMIRNNDLDAFRELLSSINLRDEIPYCIVILGRCQPTYYGSYLLHTAVSYNREEMVAMLLDAGVNANEPSVKYSSGGITGPLSIAVTIQHPRHSMDPPYFDQGPPNLDITRRIIRNLIAHGAKVSDHVLALARRMRWPREDIEEWKKLGNVGVFESRLPFLSLISGTKLPKNTTNDPAQIRYLYDDVITKEASTWIDPIENTDYVLPPDVAEYYRTEADNSPPVDLMTAARRLSNAIHKPNRTSPKPGGSRRHKRKTSRKHKNKRTTKKQ